MASASSTGLAAVMAAAAAEAGEDGTKRKLTPAQQCAALALKVDRHCKSAEKRCHSANTQLQAGKTDDAQKVGGRAACAMLLS